VSAKAATPVAAGGRAAAVAAQVRAREEQQRD